MIPKNLPTSKQTYLFTTATRIQFFCTFYYTTPITICVVPVVVSFTLVVVHPTFILCALVNFIISGPGKLVAFVIFGPGAFVAFDASGAFVAFVAPVAFVAFVVSSPGAYVTFVLSGALVAFVAPGALVALVLR